MGISLLSHLFELFFSSTWERFATAHRVAREVDAISILEKAVEDGVDIGRVADHVAQRSTASGWQGWSRPAGGGPRSPS